MLQFSRVQGTWDRPVWIIGGGPSLIGFDFDRLPKNHYKLAVNKGAWSLPYAPDFAFSLDQHFVRMCREDLVQLQEKGCQVFLALPPNEDGHKQIPGAIYLERRRGENGFSTREDHIQGLNSGFGAANLAYLHKAPVVNLLGFDFKYDEEGRSHFHEGYHWFSKRNHKFFQRWSQPFIYAKSQYDAIGTKVVNWTNDLGSNVTCFEMGRLDDI